MFIILKLNLNIYYIKIKFKNKVLLTNIYLLYKNKTFNFIKKKIELLILTSFDKLRNYLIFIKFSRSHICDEPMKRSNDQRCLHACRS